MIDASTSYGKTNQVIIRIEVEHPAPVDVKGADTITQKDGSTNIHTIRELKALDPNKAYNQNGDYDAVFQHFLDEFDALTPDGLVKTYIAGDLFSQFYSENIVSSNEMPDLKLLAKRIKEIVFDALEEEDSL